MTQQNKKLPAYPGKLEYPIEKEIKANWLMKIDFFKAKLMELAARP